MIVPSGDRTHELTRVIQRFMIGQTISHYRIIEKLGHGGMGVVYRAMDTRLHREVALKFLPQTGGPEEEARLIAEAQAASALNHPNVCAIHSVGEFQGQQFIDMELVEGKTLKVVIEDRRLTVDECVHYATQVGEALREAHRKGIVHRDIKSENIMVTPQDTLKVMDFGLAKRRGASQLTRAGSTVGTIAYMAPEQIQGMEASPQSDMFSLGVVLYEMLTGHLPFRGDHEAALIYSILNQDPPPVSEHRQDVPHALERIVRTALEKAPERRYESAEALLADLRAVPAETNVPAHDAGPAAQGTLQTVAVLPFSNLSAEKEQEYFCDGMADEIINALSQVSGLAVVARTSAFAFKGKNEDVRDIGRKLNVSVVLEGSVRKAGSRLRITAQLVDVGSGFQLWSDRFDRDADDVFAIQDEISQAIVATLKIRLVDGKITTLVKAPTDNLEAYNLFLKGRYFWSKRTERGLTASIEYFERAIAEDPRYAEAYAALADSYSLLCSYHILSPEASITKARAAASKSADLNATLAEACEAVGHVDMLYDWNWSRAERSYKRAITLNPRYATAHQRHALLLGTLGRHDEADAAIRVAARLDPLSLIINTDVALLSLIAGEYDAAIAQCRNTLDIDPEFSVALFVLGLAYEQKNMLDDAIQQFRKASQVPGASTVMKGALAHALVMSGEKQEAGAIVEELERLSQERYISPYSIGTVYAALGETNRAIDWLRRAIDTRSVWLIHLHLSVDPRLSSLQGDSRFSELLKETGVVR